MIGSNGKDTALTLPAASVAVAVNSWDPGLSTPLVKLHAPFASVVTIPICVVPSNILMVLLASAVPLTVAWFPLIASLRTIGAVGATVSTVRARAADDAPVLPAASVAVAVKLWPPLASVAVVYDHAPLAFAVAVPIWVDPSNSLTVLPASAVPVRVSVLSLVMPSPTTPVSFE